MAQARLRTRKLALNELDVPVNRSHARRKALITVTGVAVSVRGRTLGSSGTTPLPHGRAPIRHQPRPRDTHILICCCICLRRGIRRTSRGNSGGGLRRLVFPDAFDDDKRVQVQVKLKVVSTHVSCGRYFQPARQINHRPWRGERFPAVCVDATRRVPTSPPTAQCLFPHTRTWTGSWSAGSDGRSPQTVMTARMKVVCHQLCPAAALSVD
jgi:hypothetical protein